MRFGLWIYINCIRYVNLLGYIFIYFIYINIEDCMRNLVLCLLFGGGSPYANDAHMCEFGPMWIVNSELESGDWRQKVQLKRSSIASVYTLYGEPLDTHVRKRVLKTVLEYIIDGILIKYLNLIDYLCKTCGLVKFLSFLRMQCNKKVALLPSARCAEFSGLGQCFL